MAYPGGNRRDLRSGADPAFSVRRGEDVNAQ
jgi:hypothetical protein